MGVRFLMENRRRARGLGGRELKLDEARAVRMVLTRMGRLSDEQLLAMDTDIERMESVKLLEDLDYLRPENNAAMVKLERRPNAKLPHDEEVLLLAWLRRIEELQRNHRHHLHIGQLLVEGDGGDPVLRDLNLGFAHLGVLSNADDYCSRGLIDQLTELPTDWLREILRAMTSKSPLLEHLEADAGVGGLRALRDLPEDPVQRARSLHAYADYLDFQMIANAYDESGSLLLPALGTGRRLLGYRDLQREGDPDGWRRGILEELGVRLVMHLPSRVR